MSDVKLNVNSQLKKIITELEDIAKAQAKVGKAFKQTGSETEKSLKDQTKNTEKFLADVERSGMRMIENLKGGFKALLGIDMLKKALDLTDKLEKPIKSSLSLTDTIRKLGSSFGIARDEEGKFQSQMQDNLTKAKVSVSSLTDAMEALAGKEVNKEALGTYAKRSGQLASMTNDQGSVGAIAAAVAGVIKASGGKPSDTKAAEDLFQSAAKVFSITGQKIPATLDQMKKVAEAAKAGGVALSSETLGKIVTQSNRIGPGALAVAIKSLEAKGDVGKQALMTGMGFGNLVKEGAGIDLDALQRGIQGNKSRMGVLGATAQYKAAGFSEEEAQGLNLAKANLPDVKDMSSKFDKLAVDIDDVFQHGMTMAENVDAMMSRAFDSFGGLMTKFYTLSSSFFGTAAKSTETSILGALGLIGGGSLAAGTGISATAGALGITTPAVAATGAGLATGGAMALGGAVPLAAGMMALHENEVAFGGPQVPLTPGQERNNRLLQELIDKVTDLFSSKAAPAIDVHLHDPRMKATERPTRGTAH